MHELKSINIMPTARTLGVIYAIFGEAVGIIMGIAALLAGHLGRAMLAILLTGPAYGIGSFIAVGVFAFVYNAVAARLGGVEFEVTPRP